MTIQTIKAVFTGKGKLSTSSIMGAFVSLGGLMQIQAFRDPVLKFANTHPRVSSTVGAITGIAALLHNPQVQSALHIKMPPAQVKPDEPTK
jgi:hypothetical protein